VRAGIDIDRRLRRDPVALLRDRREELGHLPRVFGTYRSNLELGHRVILALQDRDRRATRQATYWVTMFALASRLPSPAPRAWPANESAVRGLLSSGDRNLCLVERRPSTKVFTSRRPDVGHRGGR
jgi:hypothetical protein